MFHRTGFAALRRLHRPPGRPRLTSSRHTTRCLSTNPVHLKPQDTGNDAVDEDFVEDLSQEERDVYRTLKPEEQAIWRKDIKAIQEYDITPEERSSLTAEASLAANEVLASLPELPEKPFRVDNSRGFLAEQEDDDQEDIGEDPEFQGDDITSEAHGELEQHRELREYARLIVWELPLLHKLAKPFEPSSVDKPLRFRYTTYLGESHPAARKIVCEFCTKDIAAAAGLSEAQRIKLIKLSSVRYNPDTDIVKMSSERLETPAQNKRYLVDLIQALIQEAKDPADMFDDVPLDFRHHKPKQQWVFPEAWKSDAADRRKLMAERQKQAEPDKATGAFGDIVQGKQLLSKALETMTVQHQGSIGEQRRPRLR